MASHKVRAVNTAPDSENRIHSLETALRYGFRDGLVPGVTVYGYMCVPVVEHFGRKWFECGSAKLRLLKPYFDGEWVEIDAAVSGDSLHVEAAGPRAIVDASMNPLLELPAMVPAFCERDKVMASEGSLAVGTTMGSYQAMDLTAPELLLEAANKAFMANYVLEPWIHTGSIVQHFRGTESASVRGTIVQEYERKGQGLVDIDYCYVTDGGEIYARVLHTAIWKLRIAT